MSFAKDFFRVHQVLIRQKFIFIQLTIEGLGLYSKLKRTTFINPHKWLPLNKG
jgi:hypothetical protein